MNTENQRLFVGGALIAHALAALTSGGGSRSVARAAEGDEVEYTFGRPVKDGEQTYAWYRKTLADEAAILSRLAARAAIQLNLTLGWQALQEESPLQKVSVG